MRRFKYERFGTGLIVDVRRPTVEDCRKCNEFQAAFILSSSKTSGNGGRKMINP
jgi:hypothetical protein